MIKLVIINCLTTDTNSCQEKRVPMENYPTPAACAVQAQQRAQE